MDNDSFRALVSGPRGPAKKKESMDLGAIRKLVNADMQRAKAKKRVAVEEDEEEKPAKRSREPNKYRDRAKERRTDTNTEKLPEVDVEMSKYLGGDVEHTHLVKGLDYVLLQKTRAEHQQQQEKAAPEEKEKEPAKPMSAVAVGVRRWLRHRETSRYAPRVFDFDLGGALLDRNKADALPATVVNHAPSDDAVILRIPDAVVEALAGKQRKKKKKKKEKKTISVEPELGDGVDIFEGAGKYLPALPSAATAVLLEDDEEEVQPASKYFARTTTQQRKPPPRVPQGGQQKPPLPAAATSQPKRKVVHRDIIGGESISASRRSKYSLNFDGTDAAYGDAITYDSDDETYAMAKQRAAEMQKKRKK
ncbi:hypothetical protein CTAYLR_009951 [Chrysophaeum taylorii]|uniref:RED-like N-terminal domain-containing protein n=1 Tax=Chrysophaeum taylorii TaxID=2483200 RepID=A0AAD7UJW1_9STRA|nr:hypothetical protein CTAYLR_009951 [Chrysophaeum taylorii]